VRIAVFGQAAFGRDVLCNVLGAGHEVVAVYAPPAGARPDPLAEEAEKRGLPLFRHKYFRRKGGEALPKRVEEYTDLGAELNLMPFTTAILPPEIVDAPPHGSLCFHPSLLPRFRGGAAIPWQIILGEGETGVTVFRPDAGVDTGPIVVQRGGVAIGVTDTAATLYFQKLYPLGLEAVQEAVTRVADGNAEYLPQDHTRATFQGLVTDDDARIDWSRPAVSLDRLIRGCDPQPGAHTRWRDTELRLFETRLESAASGGAPGTVLGIEDGRLRVAAQGAILSIGKLRPHGESKRPASEVRVEVGERLGDPLE